MKQQKTSDFTLFIFSMFSWVFYISFVDLNQTTKLIPNENKFKNKGIKSQPPFFCLFKSSNYKKKNGLALGKTPWLLFYCLSVKTSSEQKVSLKKKTSFILIFIPHHKIVELSRSQNQPSPSHWILMYRGQNGPRGGGGILFVYRGEVTMVKSHHSQMMKK